jgi:hypothetical protein
MYAFVDRNIPAITHRHVKRDALQSVVEMFLLNGIIVDEMDAKSFDDLTELEMKLIYKNMSGIAYVGIEDRNQLVSWMRNICFSLYESSIEGFDHPQLNAMLSLKPLVSTPVRHPTLPSTPTPNTAPAHATQAANPSAPRSTVQVSAEAPKAGSKTGRVWEIAEDIYKAQGAHTDFKSLRKDIVAACEAEGINGSTASVQFGRWKATKM